MKIEKQYRPRRGAKKLDLTAMKETLQDRRCWACLGIVTAGDDGSTFELTTDDVLVEVEVQPSGEKVTARLGCVAGGPGRGVWAIPPVGTEVALIVPDGETSFMPTIVATLSTGEVPSDVDETSVVIRNNLGNIIVSTDDELLLGDSSATEFAARGTTLKSFLTTFRTLFNAHVHTHGDPAGTTSAPTALLSAVPDIEADNVKVT